LNHTTVNVEVLHTQLVPMCSMKAALSFWPCCWLEVELVYHVALEWINIGSKCDVTVVTNDVELMQQEAASFKGKYASTWEWFCGKHTSHSSNTVFLDSVSSALFVWAVVHWRYMLA